MKTKFLILFSLINILGCREIAAPEAANSATSNLEVKKDGKQISNIKIVNLEAYIQECLSPECKLNLQQGDSNVLYRTFYRYPVFEKITELKELGLSDADILKEIQSYNSDEVKEVYFNYYISISPSYASSEMRSVYKDFFLSDRFRNNFCLLNEKGDKITCSMIHYESSASSVNGVHSFLLGFNRPKDVNNFTFVYQDSLITGNQINFNYQGL